MTEYLKIRNWEVWQSYRADRGQPPWIKLHRNIMRNPEWVSLTDAQRGQLVAMWLLSADRDGVIVASPAIIKKLCFMDSEPDLKLFISLNFIEPDVVAASTRRQGDANMTAQRRGEESREEERREEGPPILKKASQNQEALIRNLAVERGTTINQILANMKLAPPVMASQVTDIVEYLRAMPRPKPDFGARPPADFPDDPEISESDREAAVKALAKLKGKP